MKDRYLGAWLALSALATVIFALVGLNPVPVPIVCALAALAQYAAIRAREDREAQAAAEAAAQARRDAILQSPLGRFSHEMNQIMANLSGMQHGRATPRPRERRTQ